MVEVYIKFLILGNGIHFTQTLAHELMLLAFKLTLQFLVPCRADIDSQGLGSGV